MVEITRSLPSEGKHLRINCLAYGKGPRKRKAALHRITIGYVPLGSGVPDDLKAIAEKTVNDFFKGKDHRIKYLTTDLHYATDPGFYMWEPFSEYNQKINLWSES